MTDIDNTILLNQAYDHADMKDEIFFSMMLQENPSIVLHLLHLFCPWLEKDADESEILSPVVSSGLSGNLRFLLEKECGRRWMVDIHLFQSRDQDFSLKAAWTENDLIFDILSQIHEEERLPYSSPLLFWITDSSPFNDGLCLHTCMRTCLEAPQSDDLISPAVVILSYQEDPSILGKEEASFLNYLAGRRYENTEFTDDLKENVRMLHDNPVWRARWMFAKEKMKFL